jgi:hypothetical protein
MSALKVNLNNLESYSIADLKKELNNISNSYFETFDRDLGNAMVIIQEHINNRFMDNIDIRYYSYNNLVNLLNALTKNIVKYMDKQRNDVSVFAIYPKFFNEEYKERGRLVKIVENFAINDYYIEINFSECNTLHQLIKTLTHELRHVYQYEYALFDMFQEIKDYDYANRPHEIDAREYSENNFNSIVENISSVIYPMFSNFEVKIA